jgi:multisubunit Na+/H+ antiporter MnhE subunit
MTGTDSGQRKSRAIRHPILLAVAIVLSPALWITLVASSNPHETIVGLLASIATLVFTVIVCQNNSTQLKLQARDIAQCWRIPWYIASDVWVITLILLKDLLGLKPAENLYRVCCFDASSHDPVRIARTVMAISYTTMGPNSIVIGIDPAQSRMLFHQLSSSSIPKMTQALGAKQ